jgi:hypothetical protein
MQTHETVGHLSRATAETQQAVADLGHVKDAVAETQQIIQALAQSTADTQKAVAALAEDINAPAEVIRDPKTNRATGVRKGKRTMSIARGQDGRAAGLQ